MLLFAYIFFIMWEKLAKYFQGAGEEMNYKSSSLTLSSINSSMVSTLNETTQLLMDCKSHAITQLTRPASINSCFPWQPPVPCEWIRGQMPWRNFPNSAGACRIVNVASSLHPNATSLSQYWANVPFDCYESRKRPLPGIAIHYKNRFEHPNVIKIICKLQSHFLSVWCTYLRVFEIVSDY